MRRVVHEIRNHLAVAVATVEAFRDGVFEPSPKRLNAVLQALAEAEALLRDMPGDDAAEGGTEPVLTTHARQINVCDVITNEVLALEAAARDRAIAFTVHACTASDASCVDFAGDPVRVAEIVNNVVSNAIRYTPPGGRIDIDCRRAGGQLTLTVTDGGPGVTAQEADRIFESGYRGSAATQPGGSGFGLALVKRFVEEHGGTIDVENVPGRGARFTVRLPGTPLAGEPPQPASGTVSLL